jgi:hypothetical protein
VDVPPAVKTACIELSKLATSFSTYYVLCGGGPPCRFAEVLEALFLYAAQASNAREALKAMSERVPLEALELEHGQALAFLRRKLGPRPHWLDAVAAALAHVSTDVSAPQTPRREASSPSPLRLGLQGV